MKKQLQNVKAWGRGLFLPDPLDNQNFKNVNMSFSPKLISLILIILPICFVFIHLYVQYGRYSPTVPHRWRLDELFHLGKEANIPTWYSTALLMIAAFILLFTGLWRF